MAREYVIMESLYEVWSIDTKIINIDRTHNLEKRTEAPLKISDAVSKAVKLEGQGHICLLYTSPSPRDGLLSRMPSSA